MNCYEYPTIPFMYYAIYVLCYLCIMLFMYYVILSSYLYNNSLHVFFYNI